MTCHLPFNISHDSFCLLLQPTFTFQLIPVSPSSGITYSKKSTARVQTNQQWLIFVLYKILVAVLGFIFEVCLILVLEMIF